MCELLIKASGNGTEPGHYKRGMVVVVMPDNHPWGKEERPPTFVWIKIPLISVDAATKYIEEWKSGDSLVDRRIWRIRWADLPVAAQDLLRDTGQLTIKATTAYTGPYDYTWDQVKAYFRNYLTGLDEMADL